MMVLEPGSVKPGDVILVFTDAKRGRLNTAGQTIVRAAAAPRTERHLARYSHVMLGIRPGVVIHSDGESVKVQTLTEALHGNSVDESGFCVLRPQPPLDDESGTRIFTEAQYFLKQRYSFIPGRRSAWLGRLLQGERPLTHPFCSELVATAFAAIGRPIGSLPPDQVLPIDLELECVPPAWVEVTSEYALQPVPDLQGLPITVGERSLSLPEFVTEMDQAVAKLWQADVAQVSLTYDVIRAIVEPCVAAQRLRSAELQLSKALAAAPAVMLAQHAAMVRGDLEGLKSFYDSIADGSYASAAPFSDAMQDVMPELPPDRRAYESLPSVDALRLLERQGAALGFGAKALRLDTTFRALALGCGMPLKQDERFGGVTRELIAPFVALLPRCAISEMEELKQHIARIDVGEARFTADVRALCSTVVSLHAALSILVYDATI